MSAIGRAIACSAVSFALLAAPLLVGPAAAQSANASASANAHDAALEATRKGDYVAALDLAKQAAAAGQPLDAEQLEFISGKAEKQQAQRDAEAKAKATQVAAAATAQQIMERQQAEYAQRAARAAAAKNGAAQCAQQSNIAGTLVSSMASAQGQGIGTMGMGVGGGTAISGMPSPVSNERCGG